MQLLGVAAILGFCVLLIFTPGKLNVLRSVGAYLLADIAVLVGAPSVLLWLFRRDAQDWVLSGGAIVVLIFSQSLYTIGVYAMLGTPHDRFMAKIASGGETGTPLSLEVAADPRRFKRTECTLFTQCYLSLRPAASLRTDLEGSFLRSRNSVLYQEGALPALVRALLGISHPVFWSSRELRYYDDRKGLVAALNARGDGLNSHLREVTYVPGDSVPVRIREAIAHSTDPQLLKLHRAQDEYKIEYRSASSFYLNASLTYDQGWAAYIDGVRVPVRRAYFDSTVVDVPPGTGVVAFRYENVSSRLFFFSRYLLLLAALVLGFLIWRRATQPPKSGHTYKEQ
jgi:hypothetical protein